MRSGPESLASLNYSGCFLLSEVRMKLSNFCRYLAAVLTFAIPTGCGANSSTAGIPPVGESAAPMISPAACSLGHIRVFNGPAGGTGGVNITAGLDGDVWYGDIGLNAIVRMTTHGLTKTFTIPSGGAEPEGITTGPNSQMWFTEWTQPDIGEVNTKGRFHLFNVKQFSGQQSQSVAMVQGPDKRIWFTTGSHGLGAHKVGGATDLYSTGIDSEDLSGLTVGPNKELWYLTFSGPDIGKMTTSGKATNYNVGAYGGFGLAVGSDGRIWFPDPGNKRIGAIKSDGTGLKYYSRGLIGQPFNIVAASDGNLYFSTATTATIGRITVKGAIKECAINAPQAFDALGITIGPDKNVWLLDNQHSQVARLTLP